MALNWEQPFGRSNADNATRNSLGIITLRPTVNIQQIRRAQQMLAPFFESLSEEANDTLKSVGSIEQENAKVNLGFMALYRRPDSPSLVQILGCDTTDHAVAITYANMPTHPIVDYLFPVLSSSRREVTAHTDGTVIKFPQKQENEPLRGLSGPARLVFPGVAKLLVYWINELDGPLKHFEYMVRPANGDKNNPQSIIAVTQLG